jgi:hypothetical protein
MTPGSVDLDVAGHRRRVTDSYAAAMASVDHMREFVLDLTAQFDRAGDMDW